MSEKRKARVLLVDDEQHIIELLKIALKEMNCEIVGEAKNGLEAIEMYRKLQPNIAIMDMNMPQMDGKTALQKILAEFPDAFIVMLTAVSSFEVVEECLELGAASYIRKDQTLLEIKKNIKETWVEFKKTIASRESNA